MAEKESRNEPKGIIEPTPEALEMITPSIPLPEAIKRRGRDEESRESRIAAWVPRTEIGRDVKRGTIKDIEGILDSGKRILEPEIVDSLLNLESDLIEIGQAKGKFGGGKRRAWRTTQRKTMEGNVVSFSAMVVVGDKKGHIGVGMGKGKETLPAREKAMRYAKLSVQSVKLGCGNFDCSCNEPHSIPFIVEGKCGSVRIKLLPAPQGTGLVVGDELKKILRLAGIKDVYGVTSGQTRTTYNAIRACFDALLKTRKKK